MDATTTTAPADPQYMLALEHANKVRLARAALKRRIAFGDVNVAQVVLSCPWEVRSMAISDLLMSQRRWGRTRCRKLLAVLPLSDRKTVGSLTDRQRHVLAAILVPGGSHLLPEERSRVSIDHTAEPTTA